MNMYITGYLSLYIYISTDKHRNTFEKNIFIRLKTYQKIYHPLKRHCPQFCVNVNRIQL